MIDDWGTLLTLTGTYPQVGTQVKKYDTTISHFPHRDALIKKNLIFWKNSLSHFWGLWGHEVNFEETRGKVIHCKVPSVKVR